MNIICVAYSWFLRWVTQTSLIDIHTFPFATKLYFPCTGFFFSTYVPKTCVTSSSFDSWMNFVLHMLMCCF